MNEPNETKNKEIEKTSNAVSGNGIEYLPPSIRFKHRFLRTFLFLIGFNLFMGIVVFWALYLTFSKDIPKIEDLSQYRPPITTSFYVLDSRLVGEFAIERRTVVPYDKVPTRLVQAFIAAEDSSFFEHPGINVVSVVRATMANLLAHAYVQGGSTITQQVAKSFVGRKKTLTRKIKEMFLSFYLESHFSKRDILYLYLNQIYLGHGAYGVEAASQSYFRKHCWELTLGEMAVLAGLPQAPSRYSPYLNPKSARERQEYVLRRMFEEGYINAAERDEATKEHIVVNAIRDYFREEAPFYTEHVRRYIYDTYGEQALYEGGLKVFMAMDLDRELVAEKALTEGVRRVDKRQGYRGPLASIVKNEWEKFKTLYEKRVLKGEKLEKEKIYVGLVTGFTQFGKEGTAAEVAIGPHTGLLTAANMRWAHLWELGREYEVISSPKQVLKEGDAILVRVISEKDATNQLLLALDQIPLVEGALVSVENLTGYVVSMIGGYDFERSEFNRAFQACRQPGSAFKPVVYSAAIEDLDYNPSTILIDSPIIYDDPEHENRWKPENYTEHFDGEIILRKALVESRNVPAIKVLQAVGAKRAIEQAKKLGIESRLNEDLSLALGGSCVTPYELVNAYSVFARMGIKQNNVFITYVEDRDGRILEDNRSPYDLWQPLEVRIDRALRDVMKEDDRVMKAADVYVLDNLLQEVCRSGTAAAASVLRKTVAGKTGTTNDAYDAWFVGFSPALVAGVWVGFDTYERPLGKWETGGKAALPIWIDYMREALKFEEERPFSVPPGVVFRTIDAETGLLAVPGTRLTATAAYKAGTEPTEQTTQLNHAAQDQFFKVDTGM